VEKYKLFIKRSAAKELEAIAGRKDRERITQRIQSLADNPRPVGVEKLSGTEKYRIRQGDFRILYEIQDDVLIVFVVRIGDRKEVYRKGRT
jgi:mRNA interferase RelE/StbE